MSGITGRDDSSGVDRIDKCSRISGQAPALASELRWPIREIANRANGPRQKSRILQKHTDNWQLATGPVEALLQLISARFELDRFRGSKDQAYTRMLLLGDMPAPPPVRCPELDRGGLDLAS